jgi:opacity protein-like surface antigen
MIRNIIIAAAVLALVPAAALAQGRNEVQGFGGVTVGTSTFGSAASSTFGGRVGVGLTDNIQIIGEAGRLADIESPLFDLLDVTDIGVGVNAWYGEAGVRIIASPRSHVRPYGEATAGYARLNATVDGVSGTAGTILDAGLNLINSNRPMLGAGAGVEFGAGPLAIDVGYRYKQISAGNTIASALNAGKPYRINQVRVALGVRF